MALKSSPVVRAGASPSDHYSNKENSASAQAVDMQGLGLDQKLELPLMNFMPDGPSLPKPMDPDELNNAVEGQTL